MPIHPFSISKRVSERKKFIAKLQVDDQVLFYQEEKQEAVLDFYENLLGTAEEREYTIDLDAIGVQQHDLHIRLPFL